MAEKTNDEREFEETHGQEIEALEVSNQQPGTEVDASAGADCTALPLQQNPLEAQSQGSGASNPVSNPHLNHRLVSQLASSVPGWMTNPESIDGTVELYLKFEPSDATESVLALLAVGMTNASMDGLERANRVALRPEIRQMELQLAHKGSAAVVEVLKMLQTHRRSGNQISVGSVNISGGQAIVGTVQTNTSKQEDQER
jgi:hypothetical protein